MITYRKGKKMNILTDGLPDGVYIDGEFYPVYTDFKNWIKIDGLLSDKDLALEKRIALMLSLCRQDCRRE